MTYTTKTTNIVCREKDNSKTLSNADRASLLNKLGVSSNQAECYNAAYDLDPKILYIMNFAEATYKAGKYLESESLFKKCEEEKLRETDSDEIAYKSHCAERLGDIYGSGNLGQQDIEKATEYYTIAYNLSSKPNYWLIPKLASSLYFSENYQESIPLLEKCLETYFPSSVDKSVYAYKEDCAAKLASIYMHGKSVPVDLTKAAEYYEIMHEFNPNIENALILAVLNSHSGEYLKAESTLQFFVENDIDNIPTSIKEYCAELIETYNSSSFSNDAFHI
jgi:TPR repeat protein